MKLNINISSERNVGRKLIAEWEWEEKKEVSHFCWFGDNLDVMIWKVMQIFRFNLSKLSNTKRASVKNDGSSCSENIAGDSHPSPDPLLEQKLENLSWGDLSS